VVYHFVGADNEGDVGPQAHVVDQAVERCRGARRGDGQREACLMEGFQGLHHVGERLRDEVFGVGEEELAVGFGAGFGPVVVEVGIDMAVAVLEGQADDGAAGGLVGHGKPHLPHGLLHGDDDIAAGVAEGTVEVEEDEADGHESD